jgi:hypothetical protein
MAEASPAPEIPWLEAMRHASLDWRPPMPPSDWETIKVLVPLLPPDVRTLYVRTNGVRMPGGLKIFPLHGRRGEVSTLLSSREKGVWHFGRVGEKVQLFAVQKKRIRSDAGRARLTQWWQEAREETWVYGIRHDANRETRLFPSLPGMLKAILPSWLDHPAPGEEPDFAQSADVQLVDSGSLKIDIDVEEPAERADPTEMEVIEEVSDQWVIREPHETPPPPPDPSMLTTTQKVKVPAGKRGPRKKKTAKTKKPRRTK